MTDIELQTAQDIARIDSAIGDLMALETHAQIQIITQLKEARSQLRARLTIKPQRSDAGKTRKTSAQGSLV